VRVARRDLLDVVGDQHLGRRVVVPGQPGQPADQVLASAEVEPRTRLVEQQQLGVGHQRPRDLGALALALAQRAERPVRHGGHAPLLHQHRRPGEVVDVVALPPAADDRVAGADHEVADPLPGGDPLGQRGAGQPDPRPQLEDVDRPHGLPQDPHLPPGGVHLRGDELQQRRLARAVGSQQHPALVCTDGPVDPAQQMGLPTDDVHIPDLDDRLALHGRHPTNPTCRARDVAATRAWSRRAPC
jgi:hypothetical protein